MLIGIMGGLGEGKTVLLTKYLVFDYFKGYPILANYKLFKVEYSDIVIEEMLDKEQKKAQLRNITLGVDEITVYADCRLSGSLLNRLFSYFILQSRKRSVDIYYTTQDFGMIDKRIYAHTHIRILCESIYDFEGTLIPHFKKYTIIDMRNRMKPKIERFFMDIRPYYDYFDTDEIITPPSLKKDK